MSIRNMAFPFPSCEAVFPLKSETEWPLKFVYLSVHCSLLRCFFISMYTILNGYFYNSYTRISFVLIECIFYCYARNRQSSWAWFTKDTGSMSFLNWRKQCFVQYSTETMIEKKLTWTWLGARIFVSFYSYPHCKKLLLIYSKSDCEYTVLIAVGKCTAMSSVK